MEKIVSELLETGEPAVRYKLMVNVLRVPEHSPDVREVRERIRCSPVVTRLLSERDSDGNLPYHPYKKWTGAHWALSILADLNYPPGDRSLIPLREQVYRWLLPDLGQPHPYREKLALEGRVRTCGSQEGNALYALAALGLADERAELLARGLLTWQWPDGGWNCDRNPSATRSSFHETLAPLRGLLYFARATGDPAVKRAAERAADIFLKRGMFRRLADNEVMDPDFLALHYPCYWHYDLLAGLKVMAEGGWLGDPRCREALEWLESKRLPEGGFPAEGAFYKVAKETDFQPGHAAHWTETGAGRSLPSGMSIVDWGGKNKKKSNSWVTVDALGVLCSAGKL